MRLAVSILCETLTFLLSEVVFVWRVISVPRNHIEGRVILKGAAVQLRQLILSESTQTLHYLFGTEEGALKFGYDFKLNVLLAGARQHANIGVQQQQQKEHTRSSYAAVGVRKSRGLASPFAPIGPKLGSWK